MDSTYRLRRAVPADVRDIGVLHRSALLGLAGEHYPRDQIDGFLNSVDTVDFDLIVDGTYYVVEHEHRIVASGGWTMRRPSYVREDAKPADEPGTCATIRAVFTDPDHTRRGLARRIVCHSEEEAVTHGGAERIELCATLTGLPLYLRLGYEVTGARSLRLSNGASFPAITMAKVALPLSETDRSGPIIPAFRVPATAGHAIEPSRDPAR